MRDGALPKYLEQKITFSPKRLSLGHIPAVTARRAGAGCGKETAMSKGSSRIPEEDLTRHFRWRWNEHGIHLGGCSTLGLFVFMLYVLPFPNEKNSLADFEFLRAKCQYTSLIGPASDGEAPTWRRASISAMAKPFVIVSIQNGSAW
jgi:hypothetical protein